GREIAVKAGNKIVALDVNETQRWRRTAATVESDWIEEMKGKGIDGAKLAAEARALIDKYSE
ncbi:MAG: C4-dicarboxylate ABC transporter, partial [Ramlibacter sp.]